MWAVALRTVRDPEEAADALQDAFISAFRAADKFRAESQVTTWLHRIVVNACLDRLRRRQVRAAEPLPDDLEERAARGDVLASSTATDPATEVVVEERRRLVLAALDQLPPDQKAALVLVDMEGWSVAEAAAVLEAPTGTVKSRCARGRARLAVLLSEVLDERRGTARPSDASHRGPPDGSPDLSAHDPDQTSGGGEQP
jgi:RNA polymerase sigma-70 factor (ECF subfamily)